MVEALVPLLVFNVRGHARMGGSVLFIILVTTSRTDTVGFKVWYGVAVTEWQRIMYRISPGRSNPLHDKFASSLC